ncbi:MAG: Bug family tripartite tricarboxylate transporter substrate binding protein [Candidatus Binatia bacterium]
MEPSSRKVFCSLTTLAFVLWFFLSASAQSEQDFFKGKTITVIAGSSAGGGTDSLARLLARHFGKHIPGNPKIVVTNMAGAAGLIAANHLYNRSPKDGTVIGTMAAGLTFRTAKRDSALKLQLEKFTYLGQIALEGNIVYLRSETPFTSFEAIKRANKEGKRPKMGAQAKEHNSNVVPKALGVILGIEFDVVYGYPGTAEILLDIERGALDGRAQAAGSLFTTRSHWLEKNFVKPLVVTTARRDSRLPNVPALEELTPAEKKPLLEALYSVQGRTFAMPPGVLPERTKILRDAFAAMHKDPEFQQDVDKMGWNDELIRGEVLDKKVQDLVHNELAMGFFRKILE